MPHRLPMASLASALVVVVAGRDAAAQVVMAVSAGPSQSPDAAFPRETALEVTRCQTRVDRDLRDGVVSCPYESRCSVRNPAPNTERALLRVSFEGDRTDDRITDVTAPGLARVAKPPDEDITALATAWVGYTNASEVPGVRAAWSGDEPSVWYCSLEVAPGADVELVVRATLIGNVSSTPRPRGSFGDGFIRVLAPFRARHIFPIPAGARSTAHVTAGDWVFNHRSSPTRHEMVTVRDDWNVQVSERAMTFYGRGGDLSPLMQGAAGGLVDRVERLPDGRLRFYATSPPGRATVFASVRAETRRALSVFETGGLVAGASYVWESDGPRWLARFGWENEALTAFTMVSGVAETDGRRLRITPGIEAALPGMFLAVFPLPSIGLGVGLPIDLLPERQLWFRASASAALVVTGGVYLDVLLASSQASALAGTTVWGAYLQAGL